MVFVAALIGVYLFTRLFRLGLLPMVSDEGTYVTWGVRALHAQDLSDWLASLEDGKQPLLAWLMPPFLAVSPDRLLAGRLVSVLCGLANVLLLVRLGRRLFDPVAGWIAGGLYVLAPVALVHDRMALYDSLVATAALLVLWAALAWADAPGWRSTILLGLGAGAALLTKLSALFFVLLVPLVIPLWRRQALGSVGRWWLLAQSYFLAAAMYSVLYVSPIVGNIQDGNFQRYSLTAGEVLQLPWDVWRRNAVFVVEAAGIYLGWPLTALSLAALLWAAVRGGRAGRVAALWWLVPLIAFVLTAKIIYSRYVVFCFVCALLPAAAMIATYVWRLQGWSRRLVAAALATVVLLPGAAFALPLLTDPAAAPWMDDRAYITDRFQYVESNYAGYGLERIVDYLADQAATAPVVVLTRASTGMPRDGVTAYLLHRPNVQIAFAGERESIVQRLLREPDRAYLLAARGAPVYYVLSDAPNGEQERLFRALNPAATVVLDIPKPGDHSRFKLYRLAPALPADDVWLEPPAAVGDVVRLLGYRLEARAARPGDRLRLTLYWEATGRPSKDYTVFNHVVDRTERIWGQKDGQPAGGARPTHEWRPGDVVGDTHELVIAPDAPPGQYTVITGLYELRTLQRLAVQTGDQPASNSVALGSITILPP